jgi:hypothetical protein
MEDENSGGYFTPNTRYNFPLYQQAVSKIGGKLYLGETNTVSCGGMNGISNVFGSAIWGIDWYALGTFLI